MEKKTNREDIHIPKGFAAEEPNLLVGINGVNYILPKGKTSSVPAFVAAEIRRAQKAQNRMDETIDQLMEAAAN